MKHDKDVRGAVLTKDETRILSWSDDGTVRLWDVATVYLSYWPALGVIAARAGGQAVAPDQEALRLDIPAGNLQ